MQKYLLISAIVLTFYLFHLMSVHKGETPNKGAVELKQDVDEAEFDGQFFDLDFIDSSAPPYRRTLRQFFLTARAVKLYRRQNGELPPKDSWVVAPRGSHQKYFYEPMGDNFILEMDFEGKKFRYSKETFEWYGDQLKQAYAEVEDILSLSDTDDKRRQTLSSLNEAAIEAYTYYEKCDVLVAATSDLGSEFKKGCPKLGGIRFSHIVPQDAWGQPVAVEIQDGLPVFVSYGADGKPGGEGMNADIRRTGSLHDKRWLQIKNSL